MVKRLAALFDSLGFYYNLMITPLFLYGVYAVFANEAPNAVSTQTSHKIYMLWIACHVVAPPILWIGQLWSDEQRRWWLRWLGDSAILIMILTHVVALAKQTGSCPTNTNYLVALPLLLAVVVLCLSIRDLIRAVTAWRSCGR